MGKNKALAHQLLSQRCNGYLVQVHKGSAPRAADAARYARARQGREQLLIKRCKGGRKKGPMIWCGQRFYKAKSCLCRANCPIVLSCAVRFCYRCYVLIGSTGVTCVGEKTRGRERSNTCTRRKRKNKKSSTQQHVLYPVVLYVRKKAHSTAQHSTAARGTARHRTALRGAVGLYIAGLI